MALGVFVILFCCRGLLTEALRSVDCDNEHSRPGQCLIPGAELSGPNAILLTDLHGNSTLDPRRAKVRSDLAQAAMALADAQAVMELPASSEDPSPALDAGPSAASQSFAELLRVVRASAQAQNPLRSCGFCVLVIGAVSAMLAGLCKAVHNCFKLEEGWYRDIRCLEPIFRQYYKFDAEFPLLVCIHKVKMEAGDNSEYVVWALGREAGKGKTPPPKSILLGKNKVEGRRRFFAQFQHATKDFPESVEICARPSRPDIQLAVYRQSKGRSVSDGEYIGSVCFCLNEFAAKRQVSDLPTDKQYQVLGPRGKPAGKLIASLYKDDGRNDALLKSFVRESNTKVPLATMAAISLAVGPSKGVRLAITRAEVWARLLSGNFLAVYGAGSSGQVLDFSSLPKGALNLKYFQMKHKKNAQRWFWVWYQRPLTDEDGPVGADNAMEGYIPLRSIVGVSVVPNNPHALVIRYLRKEQGLTNPQGELYVSAQGPKKDVSRMLDAVRGRDELMFALRAMREEPEDRMASGDPAAIEVDIPHSSDDSPNGDARSDIRKKKKEEESETEDELADTPLVKKKKKKHGH